MTDHECIHTVDFVQLNNDIKAIKDSQLRSEQRLEKIDTTVFGNGRAGHTTQIARHSDAIKRQWWAVGIILVGLAGIAIKNLL